MNRDSKGRAFHTDRNWLVVTTDIYQALKLSLVAWWRLAPDGVDREIWCLDLVAAERIVKLYFDDEAQGLAWLSTWMDVPAPPDDLASQEDSAL